MSARGRSEDLGALFARAARRIAVAEAPLLAAHDLTMWDYVVLTALARGGPARNQLALARAVHHDKSRLVTLLDGLEDRALIRRDRDPADRRSLVISLTEPGRRAQRSAQAAIRGLERSLLSFLDASERALLDGVLATLAVELDAQGEPSPDGS